MGIDCPRCHFDNPDDTLYCRKYAIPFPSSREIPVAETRKTPKEELIIYSNLVEMCQIIMELARGGMSRP